LTGRIPPVRYALCRVHFLAVKLYYPIASTLLQHTEEMKLRFVLVPL
jgi:hypothetical protein